MYGRTSNFYDPFIRLLDDKRIKTPSHFISSLSVTSFQ
nr:MAG TPA: hypothetical protein [Caudoviricetes sp.]